jgi:hypothetical protein
MRVNWIAALLLCACSTESTETSDTRQADTETSCDVSALAWNLDTARPKVCAGPWQYQELKDCSVLQNQVSCFADGASDPQSCANVLAPGSTVTTPASLACPEASRISNRSHFVPASCYFATTYDSNAEHRHEAMKTKKIQTCKKWSSDGDCIMYTYVTVAAETCDQHAQARVNIYHSSYMGGSSGTANFGAWVIYENPVTSGLYCDYDLYNVPTDYHYGADSPSLPICGGHSVPDPDYVTYASCYNPGKPPTYRCGSLPDLHFTAIGQLASVIDATADGASEQCLTGEQYDLPTAGDPDPATKVQAKHAFLRSNYEHAVASGYAGVDNTALAAMLERNLKLLFESYGEYLTPEQRAYSRGLYAIDDNLPTTNGAACGAAYTPPLATSCDLEPQLQPLDRQLAMCTRLRSHHVHGVKDVEDVVDACIDVADQIGALRSSFIAHGGNDDGARPPDNEPLLVECGYVGYRELWHQVVTDPLASHFEKLVDLKNNAAQDTPETQSRMRLLDRWYSKTEHDFYPFAATSNGTALSDPLVRARWRETSKLAGSFWRGIYRQLFSMADQYAAGSGSGSATIPDAADIEAAAHDSLIADRTILGLLYPPSGQTPPLTGAPLLMLTGDALQAMTKRLQDISVYHDMGCSYLGCANGRNDSETAYLYRFFAGLASAQGLAQVVSDANAANGAAPTPVVRPEWLTVFSQLAAQHSTFELAVCDAENVPAASCDAAHYATLETAMETAPTSLSPPATPLGSLIQDANVRWSSYSKSGMLDPGARNKLSAGIQQAQIDAVINDLRTTANNLDAKTSTYSSTMQQLAASYLTDLAQQNKLSDVEAQIEVKQATIGRQTADVAGLREKLDRDQDLWGSFLDSYKTVTDVDGNALVATEDLGTFAMAATSARATGPLGHGDVSTLLAAPNKYTVVKGDILHITVSGNWSPTCMLQATGGKVAIPDDDQMAVDYTTNPQIGPEGFTLTLNNGTLSTKANTTSETNSSESGSTFDAGICAGIHAEAGWSTGSGPGFDASIKAYVDASLCAKINSSSSSTYNEGSSSSQSTSASASIATSSGVRLPNTPFPNQPAGSVVLVYTSPGQPTQILRTEVVLRQYATIAPADADVYIVANDITAPPCQPDASSALSLSVQRLQTAASAAANVKTALNNVLDTITAQSDAFVAQGSFSAADQTSLRSAAISAISSSTGCNCNFATYPDPIKNFFYAWIDHEIATIDKKVQIYNLQRANNAVLLDIEGLSQDLVYADKAGHIAAMTPAWSLRNLDMELLRAEVRKVMTSMTYDLYPILKLRFPTIFAGLASDEVLLPQVQTLVNAHWDDPVDNLAHAAYQASQALLDATSTIAVHQADLAITTIGLQFTRPGAAKFMQFPYADDGRSKAVWDQITTPPHIVTFSVTPEDLYRLGGGSYLSCTQEAPVIRDLAVVVSGQDSDTTARFNPLYWYGPTWVSATVLFPLARVFDQVLGRWMPGELESYTLADSGWQQQLSQFLFADTATTTFSKYDEKRPITGTTFTTARGLSPFTQFTIDFSSFYASDKLVNGIQPLFDPANPTRAKQVTLVMRLESRLNSPTLDFLPTCH